MNPSTIPSWKSNHQSMWGTAALAAGTFFLAISELWAKQLREATFWELVEAILAIALTAAIIRFVNAHADDSEKGRRLAQCAGLGLGGIFGLLSMANITIWHLATLLPR